MVNFQFAWELYGNKCIQCVTYLPNLCSHHYKSSLHLHPCVNNKHLRIINYILQTQLSGFVWRKRGLKNYHTESQWERKYLRRKREYTVVYTHIAVLIVQRCWITEHYPSQLTSRCIYIYIYLQFVFVGDRDKTCPNRNWYIYQLPSAGWGSLWAGSPSGGRRQYRLQHGISCTDWPTNLGQWATG